MSPGDQIIAALIDGFFQLIVNILVASFEAIVLPWLESLLGS